MIELYGRVQDFVLKPILYTGLAAMVLIGCDKAENSKQNQPIEVRQEKDYFDNWGFVDNIRNFNIDNPLEIKLGDIDGDGDLDIVVATNWGGLRIYENRIPRK